MSSAIPASVPGQRIGQRRRLQAKVEAQGLIEGGKQVGWQRPDLSTDALDGDRTNLLGLSFGVEPEAGLSCGQHDLKRIDAFRPRRHRHHSEDSPSEALGGTVRSIVADDYCRAPLVCL